MTTYFFWETGSGLKLTKNIEIENIKNLTKQVRCYLEILAIIKKHNKNKLCGFCGVGSAFLQRVGKILGFDFDFVCGMYRSRNHISGHCWVEYKNLIIDVTGDQFYKDIKEPIYIIKRNKRYRKRFVNTKAISYMNNSWPSEQLLKTYEQELEKIAITVGKQILQKQKALSK